MSSAMVENRILYPHRIHGTNGIFTYVTWMVDFFFEKVGKYTVRPVDPMGIVCMNS